MMLLDKQHLPAVPYSEWAAAVAFLLLRLLFLLWLLLLRLLFLLRWLLLRGLVGATGVGAGDGTAPQRRS